MLSVRFPDLGGEKSCRTRKPGKREEMGVDRGLAHMCLQMPGPGGACMLGGLAPARYIVIGILVVRASLCAASVPAGYAFGGGAVCAGGGSCATSIGEKCGHDEVENDELWALPRTCL